VIGVVVFPVGIGYFIPAGVGTFRGEVARNNPQVLESVHAVGDVIGVIFFPMGVGYFIPAGEALSEERLPGLSASFDLKERQGPSGGYKIALTTAVMQRMVGFDSSAAGFILANAIHQSPAILRGADFVRLGIECEIAVQPTPQFLGYRFWEPIPSDGAVGLPIERDPEWSTS